MYYRITKRITFVSTVLATLPTRPAHPGGAFFYIPVVDCMSVPFNKPATTIPEQIALLRERGLIIENKEITEHYLLHVGYYRLAGYWQIFQRDRTRHTFIEKASIEQIIDLYNFDRDLRLLLLDAIECIEVSFRSVLSDEMCCEYGPFWYTEKEYAYKEETFEVIMMDIRKELTRSNEEFVRHHNIKYGREGYPPAWKTFQVLSFGTLSRLYGNIHNDIDKRKTIAKKYGLPAEAWLHSWMQVISVLRNYCAHHSRVCYRTFSYPPKDMHRPRLPWIKNTPPTDGTLNQLLYYQLCVVRYLLHSCRPQNHFTEKLKQLITRYPSIEIQRMGFIPNWEKEDLWQ